MNEREINHAGDGVVIRCVPQSPFGGVQIDEHLLADHPGGAPESPVLCAIRKLQAGYHGLILARTLPLAQRMLRSLLAACPAGFQPIKRTRDACRFPSGAIVAAAGVRCDLTGACADWLWLETEDLHSHVDFDRRLRPVIVHSREKQPVIVGAA